MKHFVPSFRFLFTLLTLAAISTAGIAQTSISGVVNEYVSVSDIDVSLNSVTVSSTNGFQIGDKVIIMQMQGANISTTDNNTYGQISNYNGAGSYELAEVCGINGNNITFSNILVNQNYRPNGGLQLIKVPTYGNATVSGTLTGLPWDGSKGGVVAIHVAGTLTLDANVIMDGMGFRGGAYENSNSNNCGYLTNRTGFIYNNSNYAARKGEGLAPFISGSEYGRGPQATGGGGGNDNNSGGGGGANAGSGGLGGENQDPSIFNCKGFNSGWGGIEPNTANRLMMGGGGGAGHGDDNSGSRGGNGGGIVIIMANTLQVGLGSTISVNGETAPNSISDGAGGGGAAGSIQLEVGSFVGNAVLTAYGGNGGSANNENLDRCFGPGGGGSGGLIKVSPTLPTHVATNIVGGYNGHSINTTNFICNANSSVGAQRGGSGKISVAPMPAGSSSSLVCQPLPVTWLDVTVSPKEGQHQVSWRTGAEFNNSHFTVERSENGVAYESLGDVNSQGGTTNTLLAYKYMDQHPPQGISHYRVRQTNLDGEFTYSNTVSIQNLAQFSTKAYPNPWNGEGSVNVEVILPNSGLVTLQIFDVVGKMVYQAEHDLEQGVSSLSISDVNFNNGTYFIKAKHGKEYFSHKLVIVQ